MMAKITASLLIFLAIFCQCSRAQNSSVIVSPNCSQEDQSCRDIDSALDELASGVSLYLLPGHHLMMQTHQAARGTSNISMIGHGVQDTVISCGNEIGFTFIGMENIFFANFTVTNCGLTGLNLNLSVTLLEEVINLWVLVPEVAEIALFIGDCRDVTIEDIIITNTTGLGLLGINIVGRSVLNRVNFTRNIRPQCLDMEPTVPSLITPEILDQVGGGAYFLYSDYRNMSVDGVSLALNQCHFAYNGDCTYAATTNVNFPYYTSNGEGLYQYSIGAGGGLSVVLANSFFGVNVSVIDTVFRRNDARYGAGAYVATFAGYQHHLETIFLNCTFLENGVTDPDPDNVLERSYCQGGAGIAIFTDLVKPEHIMGPVSHTDQKVLVAFSRSEFVGNQASTQGGGLMAYSLYYTPRTTLDLNEDYFLIIWAFIDTKFTRNSAQYGSAAHFNQFSLSNFVGSVLVAFSNIFVSGNAYVMSREIQEAASAIQMHQMTVGVFDENIFSDNLGSALSLEFSALTVSPHASMTFQGNIAQRGGGVHFIGDYSTFFLSPFSNIRFINNSAIIEGGAVYFSSARFNGRLLLPFGFFGCFITTPFATGPTNPNGNYNLFDNGIVILFQNNRAPVGSIVFGSTLENCPWAKNVSKEDGLSLYQVLHRDRNSTFVFDTEPVGREFVSTLPAGFNVSLASTSAYPGVVPGEEVDIDLDVFDEFGNEIFAVVTSEVRDLNGISVLGESGFWFTAQDNATVRIFGSPNQNLNVSYFTFVNVITTSVETTLLSCPAGFKYNIETSGCECDEDLLTPSHSRFLSCDPLSVTISTTERYWFGTELDSTNSTDLNDIILQECHFDYCEENSTFRPPNYDTQCRVNSYRTGVLCGSCMANYSVVFGSSECKICSNYYLFTIPIFIIAGILVFLAIAFLEFTIDKGWLNAVLFYSNIVVLYTFEATNIHWLFLPAHLLSLEVGFSLCFFDGMTALSRAVLHFLFPTYLFILIGIFSLLARRYSLSCYFSPAKTFVTINLLSYLSLLSTCIEILVGRSIFNVRGVRSSRWVIDANQLYFRDWHAVLGVVALIVVVGYLTTFPILLLFPSLVYKRLKSGKPFYDALFAPFKEKYRFWIGLRLIMRAFMTAHASFFTTSNGLLINTVVLLAFLHVQTSLRPYKSKWLNAMDSFLIVNAIILYTGILSAINKLASFAAEVIYACVFLGMAYIVIIIIFGYHIDSRFPNIREKLMKIIHSVMKSRRPKMTESNEMCSPHDRPTVSSTSISIISHDEPHIQEPRPNSNDYYRDSILDTI